MVTLDDRCEKCKETDNLGVMYVCEHDGEYHTCMPLEEVDINGKNKYSSHLLCEHTTYVRESEGFFSPHFFCKDSVHQYDDSKYIPLLTRRQQCEEELEKL